MRRLVVTMLAVALAGCLTPRSMVLGQTASPLGEGAAEVALASGFAYQSESRPPVEAGPLRSQVVARGFSLPAFEANGQVGLTERVGLNLHASTAGLQPGIKVTLNKGPARVALLPQLGLGYGSSASSTFVTGIDGRETETGPTASTRLVLTFGLKAIASHRSGLYGGVGYDFLSLTDHESRVVGQSTETSSTGTVQHGVTFAIGYEAKLEQVRIRSEVAAAYIPAIFTSTRSSGATVEGSGGRGFVIMPTLTFAVATPPRQEDPEPEEEERPEDEED